MSLFGPGEFLVVAVAGRALFRETRDRSFTPSAVTLDAALTRGNGFFVTPFRGLSPLREDGDGSTSRRSPSLSTWTLLAGRRRKPSRERLRAGGAFSPRTERRMWASKSFTVEAVCGTSSQQSVRPLRPPDHRRRTRHLEQAWRNAAGDEENAAAAAADLESGVIITLDCNSRRGHFWVSGVSGDRDTRKKGHECRHTEMEPGPSDRRREGRGGGHRSSWMESEEGGGARLVGREETLPPRLLPEETERGRREIALGRLIRGWLGNPQGSGRQPPPGTFRTGRKRQLSGSQLRRRLPIGDTAHGDGLAGTAGRAQQGSRTEECLGRLRPLATSLGRLLWGRTTSPRPANPAGHSTAALLVTDSPETAPPRRRPDGTSTGTRTHLLQSGFLTASGRCAGWQMVRNP